jgi:hypothetical protein
MENSIQLETGLSWYYVHEKEFDQREYPVEKRAALAFEAGREAGRHEVVETVLIKLGKTP